MNGRRGYEDLLPMTIGFNTNKNQNLRSNFEIFNRVSLKNGFP